MSCNIARLLHTYFSSFYIYTSITSTAFLYAHVIIVIHPTCTSPGPFKAKIVWDNLMKIICVKIFKHWVTPLNAMIYSPNNSILYITNTRYNRSVWPSHNIIHVYNTSFLYSCLLSFKIIVHKLESSILVKHNGMQFTSLFDKFWIQLCKYQAPIKNKVTKKVNKM